MKNIGKELIIGFIIILIFGILVFSQLSRKQDIGVSQKTEKPVIGNQQEKELKEFDKEEVARHASKDDCYMIIEGKVYDLTSYINKHPGGIIIADYCGKDGTEAFNARGREKEPHSPRAREILKNYYLGELKK